MADWTNIANTALQPGAPVRSIDGVALRDNPIAIAEGAAGAPRIQRNAIQNSAVNNEKIANSAVTSAKLATGANERDWVLARTAGASAGAVGTYAFLADPTNSGTNVAVGSILAGSSLRYSSVHFESGFWVVDRAQGAPNGTWRIMGFGNRLLGTGNARYGSLFLRIA